MDFEFNWKFKDFEIRTAHHWQDGEPYLELVKWDNGGGRQYCFTLAYWHRDKDGYYELHFVADRPLEYVAEIEIGVIWKQLFLAQQMFEDAVKRNKDME